MRWVVTILPAALPELEALPEDMQAKFQRLVVLIENHGLEHLREPYAKHLQGKLWEMRMSGRDGISRAIYIAAQGRRVIVARVHEENRENAAAGARDRAAAGEGGPMKLIRAVDLHRKWMKNPAYRREYAALEGEFALVGAMMEARGRAGLTQAQVAKRMKTTQTAVARLEGGRIKPSTRTLERYARATGHKLVIGFEPVKGRKRAASPGQ